MPSHRHARSMHRCYPAHAHTQTTSTRYKQAGETTTGEDKCAKCNPHVNKRHNAPQCALQLPPAPSTALACAWGLGSIRQRNVEEEEEQPG